MDACPGKRRAGPACGGDDGMSDAVGARDRNEFARRMNGGHRFEMGIEISLLAEISGDADRPDLGQPELAKRIDHAGVDVQPSGVDHLRAAGNRQVAADAGDAAVLDHDRAALDRLAGQRVDGGSADRVRGALPLSERRPPEDQQPEQEARGPHCPGKTPRSEPASQCHGRSSPLAESAGCFFALAAAFLRFASASFSLDSRAFFSSATAFRRFRSCS